jgi:hypothetical protein
MIDRVRAVKLTLQQCTWDAAYTSSRLCIVTVESTPLLLFTSLTVVSIAQRAGASQMLFELYSVYHYFMYDTHCYSRKAS